MAKNINQTYLHSLYPAYERQLFNFIMTGERIDTTEEAFSSILYDIKVRQVNNNMFKAIQSSKIKLVIGANPLGKAVKVFTIKDVKNGSKDRVTFIDVSNIIHKDI